MGNNKIISDEDEKKIRAMRLGDKNAILWGLKCTGLHYRINAIACAVMYNITDDDIIDSIKRIKVRDLHFYWYKCFGMCVCSSGYIGN